MIAWAGGGGCNTLQYPAIPTETLSASTCHRSTAGPPPVLPSWPPPVPQAYSNSLVDHHLILDLITPLAHAYFCGRLPAALSYSQAAILTCVGLQQHEIGGVRAGCWDAAVLCWAARGLHWISCGN